MRIDRRGIIVGAAAVAASGCVPLNTAPDGRLEAKLRLIEVAAGGRLGVAFVDPVQRLTLGYRAGERFPMASTFKASLAALLLAKADDVDADRVMRWTEADLQSYAPFAKERLATGATLRELAQAAVEASDNTAANLLLARLGGPAALTAFWRAFGDDVSRLDDIEPQLNFVPQGDPRNTTTPAAMAGTIGRLLGESVLPVPSRASLRKWLAGATTGLTKVRAGVPSTWEAGDKTGNSGNWPGMGYARGDIGYVVGPASEPIAFAVYHQSPVDAPIAAAKVDEAFAEVGRTLTTWVRRNYTIVLT
ncbi:Beta-lactamase [Tsuneonella dongtanensis]|uniref:Beta-lactamase n=1 Tax=Tsuneonella dongtanensis TaxID=692370 RepID=A0A1B2AC19_9SPHN|nr:class A beta-lactamase [Tsuneonella dongtanensis]ANY19696.1 Beta-lactamase [Tsuneonella dongtanensis]